MHLGMYNINENGYVDYVTKELKLHKPYEYFNTKIMLLNTDKIRNSFNIKDIFNKVKTNKYNELEQDLFNNLLNGKVKYFDYKYSIISEVDTFVNSRIEYAPMHIEKHKQIHLLLILIIIQNHGVIQIYLIHINGGKLQEKHHFMK